jgi:hypothetical protein
MTFWNAWRPLADVRFANPTTCRGDSELPTSRNRTVMPMASPSRSSTMVVDHLLRRGQHFSIRPHGADHPNGTLIATRRETNGLLLSLVEPPEELVENQQTNGGFSRSCVCNHEDGLLTARHMECELPQAIRDTQIWFDGI